MEMGNVCAQEKDAKKGGSESKNERKIKKTKEKREKKTGFKMVCFGCGRKRNGHLWVEIAICENECFQ